MARLCGECVQRFPHGKQLFAPYEGSLVGILLGAILLVGVLAQVPLSHLPPTQCVNRQAVRNSKTEPAHVPDVFALYLGKQFLKRMLCDLAGLVIVSELSYQ